ncbi:MAG: VanZ family protein [Bacilli bacterium]|nr:VanZ family protein [Bacilli bacterium]
MKNKVYGYLSVFCYVVSFLILLFCINVKLIPSFYLNTQGRLVLLSIVCIMIYISGYILVNKLNYTKKILRVNLIIYFLIYTVTIFSLTLFDEIYGRQGLIIIDWDKNLLNNYLTNSFNLKPFHTIHLFIKGYIDGIVSYKNFSINVIGNLTAFMPYGLFLPIIFKNMRKYYNFLIIMILIVVVIELLQFVTMSGSCDIDDLILNVLGASIIYFVSKIKIINKLINKIFLFE